MKKAPLYSRSRRPAPEEAEPVAAAPSAAAATPTRRRRLAAWAGRHERLLWIAALVVLGAAFWFGRPAPAGAPLTFEQIDHLVRKSIDEKPLPSAVTRAYEKVLPSVVRVVGLMNPDDDGSDRPADKSPEKTPEKPAPEKTPEAKGPAGGKDNRSAKGPAKDAPLPKDAPRDGSREAAREARPMERGVGTGVVIVDNGTILTNLHVVLGAHRIRVTFADGLESEARLVSVMPEHDLAVLRALKIPDDLHAATMRSTGDLAPGDHVAAIGFPFGIGPSASSGIVSGLKREFRSPEGERVLTNLIQFDAAANPGNSGGPLVTMEGEVVGIVTAILNPTKQRVFVGIGFAVPIENAASGAGLPPF
jgi:serine protease DegQ